MVIPSTKKGYIQDFYVLNPKQESIFLNVLNEYESIV